MKTFFLTYILLCSFSICSFACSCGGAPSFCVSAKNSLAVLEVEVIKKYHGPQDSYRRYVDFRVLNTLSSEDSILYKNLTLMEGASTCDVNFYDKVDVKEKFIIVYDFVDKKIEANHPVIYFNICNNSYLTIDNATVIGDITMIDPDSDEKISRNKFVKNIHDLCNLTILDASQIIIKNNSFESQIGIKNNYSTSLDFELFNSAGQLVYQNQIESEEEIWIEIIDYPSDMYFIRFRNPFTQITEKLVIFK